MKMYGQSTSWENERRYARLAGARGIKVRAGEETERVLVTSVIDREVFFCAGGVYIIRDGETVVYIGATAKSLCARIRGAMANREKWTEERWDNPRFLGWTVSMTCTEGNSDADQELATGMIMRLRPKFNTRGVTKAPYFKVKSEGIESLSRKIGG